MVVIGDMLGVLPEDREMFLRWSDDMVNALSSTTEQTDSGRDGRDRGVHRVLTRMIAGAQGRPDRRPHERARARRGRRREAGRPRDRHTSLAAPHRRRRDDPAHVSGGIEQLLLHPEQHQLLVDDLALLPSAVEEMLRWVARSRTCPAR